MVTTLLSWLRAARETKRWNWLFAAAILFSFRSAAAAADLAGQPKRQPIRIELGQVVPPARDVVKILFSPNGQMIYAWWHDWRVAPKEQGYLRQADQFRVFSLEGKQLCSSKDADHSLVWSNFPSVAWREAEAGFVTNAAAWIFDPAHSWGLRVFELSSRWAVRLECWSLPQAPNSAPLWSREIEKASWCRPIATVDSAGEEVLLAMLRGKASIVSRRTGETIREFTLGHIETQKEAASRQRKFGLQVEDDDPSLYFSPHVFSYEEKRRLLACGAFFDKRVRVVDIGPPVKVVFEANTEVNPAKPRGGVWEVRRVDFASGGKYLIAGYDFGGKRTKVSIDSTEIFETTSWKCVWSEDDPDIGSVTLSPDGRSLGYVRGKAIEIIPFQPKR